jgi:integrase
VEDRGALEVARRDLQHISHIFRYAIASGRAARNPAADIKGALRPQPRVKHRAALRERDLPEFFAKLQTYDGEEQTRLAIELVVHTFVRTAELRFAHKSEFEGDLWRIPAERMKMKREHIVPLSFQAKRILDRLMTVTSGNVLAPMSENTMLYAMYRMGYHGRATIHGFRGTASTILNESGLWNRDWIERQLAHVPEDKVRSAYNAAEYLPDRRRMMTWYSERLEELGSSAGR